jgi:sulfur relay (sulfurtransferase) DsrF/TusC family protein
MVIMSSNVENIRDSQHLIMMIKSPPKNGLNAFSSFGDFFANLDEGIKPIIIFIFNGVLNILKNTLDNGIIQQKNESFDESLLDMATFFVFKESLERRNLIGKKLLPGIKKLDMKNFVKIIRDFGDDIVFF